MFERRLMERIAAGHARPETRSPDPSAVLADVLAHLHSLLNARQGSVPTRPDYGMPDINDLLHQFPNSVGVLRRAIIQQIDRFEPRLRRVQARHLPDERNPLRLVFAISAELVLDERAEAVSFTTAVADSGAVFLAG
ncbi:type VI secretion system baseplate subunit TssE [Roseomonas sp. NAR14]|uniref:Type VI secretion system baseplate subunit TssE n=1 Tax=Roseomonas acroporae TaxID=2937791 RepID=A0A9X1Y750_9PROT|nr:type VI secretion system baseplate subunit TssE [Roseomonas acroporae]MCK8784360.1 type VI secretion system baseplate subunit TssE [Roseomonas acroporae]